MDNSKLPLRTWLLGMYLLGQSKTNLSALELMRHLGVSYPTAWRMKHKLMQAMTQREANRKLGGIVQLDDAYLGGERNGGKAGRGSENKRPFVIAVETTEDGRPLRAVMDPVPGFTKAALSEWIGQRLHPGADVYSDGLGAFRALEAEHAHTVIEGSGRSRCEAENARWVNVVLSNPKAFAGRCLSRLQIRQIRPALPGRDDVAVQPPFRSDPAGAQLAGRRSRQQAVVRAGPA